MYIGETILRSQKQGWLKHTLKMRGLERHILRLWSAEASVHKPHLRHTQGIRQQGYLWLGLLLQWKEERGMQVERHRSTSLVKMDLREKDSRMLQQPFWRMLGPAWNLDKLWMTR
jgi:hypothetical protein